MNKRIAIRMLTDFRASTFASPGFALDQEDEFDAAVDWVVALIEKYNAATIALADEGAL